jgi:ABC-type sugar transport system substrate-binding protein
LLLIVVVALLGAILTACGSSGSSSSNDTEASSTTSESNPAEGTESGFPEAVAETEKWEEERTGPPIAPLKKPVPKDADVVVVGCVIPSCKPTTEGSVDAAKELGYNVDLKIYESTPEGYQHTFEEIAREPPNIMTFISGFPDATIEGSLKKMAAAGTAIVQITPQAGETPNEIVGSVQQGPPFWELGGEVAAYKILADAGEPFESAVVRDPSFGFSQPAQEAYEKTIEENCPECKVGLVEVSLIAPPQQALSQAVNYLRQHTDTKYLFYVNSDQAIGLPEALEAGGLSGVQFVTLTANLTDLQQVSEGKQLATIQNENYSQGYRAIDAGLRILVEGNAGPEKFPDGYTRILSEANVEPDELPRTPGTPEDYRAAWGLE